MASSFESPLGKSWLRHSPCTNAGGGPSTEIFNIEVLEPSNKIKIADDVNNLDVICRKLDDIYAGVDDIRECADHLRNFLLLLSVAREL